MKAGVLVAATLVVTTACGSTPPDDGRPQIIASFYPYAFVAEQVGGPLVHVESLTAAGVEPHDVELRPKQVARVHDADLVIYQKDFQPAVDDAVKLAGRPAANVVNVAKLVTLHAESPDEADDHGHSHDAGAADPHVWLDPTQLIPVAKETAARLAAVDPEHAAEYRANADRLIGQLTDLDTRFTDGLANCKRDTIVTSHAAFSYLAERYGLHQLSIAGIDPSSEPSGRQLARITDEVRHHGITTVFTEELVDPANAKTIAAATGVKVAVLDPIEGLGPDTADQTYLTLMNRNFEAIREANGCS